MIIHFGPHLDGMQPAPPMTVGGEASLGLARMLGLLELRLGLPPVLARPGEALLAFQACLAELDGPTRFYHRSFRVDSLGVSRTLLDWRADWYEHGWKGVFDPGVSRRLADMAAIEALARDRVPLTQGQRIQRVLKALDMGLTTGIDRIVLHCERAELPPMWQLLLERFVTETASGVKPQAQAAPDTDLGRVQRTLLELATAGNEGVPRARETLSRDASFIVVRGISRDLSAQAIAEYLLQTQEAYAQTVVIAESDGIILDNALERVGLPRAGFQHYSRFRAVTQVLKLCLGLLWDPIDAQLLLQFLIHPVGPLPDHARSTLAQAVAAQPGVGGTEWRKAVVDIAERMRTKFGQSESEIERVQQEIKYWLECERYLPKEGASLTVLIERTQRCINWFAGRLHAIDDEDAASDLFASAAGQGEALVAALAALHVRGELRIARIPLERLVDEVGGRAADPYAFAQAGHVRSATEPAAISEPWQRVIWWDLAPRQPATAYPWSDTELAELRGHGVVLPPVEERIDTRIRGWLRPILSARSQLILVVHDRDEGHHPLWSQLRSAFEGWIETRIEDAMFASPGKTSIPALGVPTEPLETKALQQPRRWWQLPDDCKLPARAQESFSSLDKLLRYPHDYVLTYSAKLYRGRVSDMTDENLLYGNLAHRLLERFFTTVTDWPRIGEGVIRAWLSEHLPVLVRQEGALLYAPGRGVIRERVLATLESTLVRLLAHLRSAGIEEVTAEDYGEAPFKDTTLCGTIDLLLRDARGQEIVLDVKWGGQLYKGADLAANRHLQLATYAYLRHVTCHVARWPYQAYYIASTGNVLAPDASVFPNALVFAPPPGENADALWTRVGAAYDWRRAQLAAGRIEVVAAGTEGAAESESPTQAFDCSARPSLFDEFTWLTGWDEGV